EWRRENEKWRGCSTGTLPWSPEGGAGPGGGAAGGFGGGGGNVFWWEATAEQGGGAPTGHQGGGGGRRGRGARDTAAGERGREWRVDAEGGDRCREVAAKIGATIGQVSILVNNAGINRRNAFTAEPEAVIKDWQDIMAVNLNGMFNVAHAFLSQLRATRGRIV